jgi:hypothetical protein
LPALSKNALPPDDAACVASLNVTVWLTVCQPALKPGGTGFAGSKPGVPGRFAAVPKTISAIISWRSV